MNLENMEQANIQATNKHVPNSELLAAGEVITDNQAPVGKPALPNSIIQDSNIGVSIDDQSQIMNLSIISRANQEPANISEPISEKILSKRSQQLYFGKKRPLPPSEDDVKKPFVDTFSSQSSHQLSSQMDGLTQIVGDCNRCKEYKVEIKRIKQTILRMTKDAAAAKKRQDNNLATSLRAQEAMQKELTILRSSNVKLHIEMTDVKGVIRDIQSALGRCKF